MWEYVYCQIWCIPGDLTSFGFCLDSLNAINSAKVILVKLNLLKKYSNVDDNNSQKLQ